MYKYDFMTGLNWNIIIVVDNSYTLVQLEEVILYTSSFIFSVR